MKAEGEGGGEGELADLRGSVNEAIKESNLKMKNKYMKL